MGSLDVPPVAPKGGDGRRSNASRLRLDATRPPRGGAVASLTGIEAPHVQRRRPDHATARRVPTLTRRDGRRTRQGHHRPGRGHRADPGRHLHPRPLPAGRRPRPGQDADGQLDRPDPRRRLQAHPVHARPDALGHHRDQRPGGARGRAAGSSGSSRGRSSPTSSWPTRSTAPRPRPRPRCCRRCRSARSPSARRRYNLPDPFFVIATQNPIEQEGTYPLPEAQLDRFMFNIKVDYPTLRGGEADPLDDDQGRGRRADEGALGAGRSSTCRSWSRSVPVGDYVVEVRGAAGAGDPAGRPDGRRSSSRSWSTGARARAPASS